MLKLKVMSIFKGFTASSDAVRSCPCKPCKLTKHINFLYLNLDRTLKKHFTDDQQRFRQACASRSLASVFPKHLRNFWMHREVWNQLQAHVHTFIVPLDNSPNAFQGRTLCICDKYRFHVTVQIFVITKLNRIH